MTRHKTPDPPRKEILDAIKQIDISEDVSFDKIQETLRMVVKELKKQKITQLDICELLIKETGKKYTVIHLRNNIMQKPGYEQTAAWVLQCLGFKVSYKIKTPKGEG